MSRLVVVAVGGNALIRAGQSGTAEEQFENAMETAGAVVELLKTGCRVILTHGNGPQVGAALTRSEFASSRVYRMPYDCCVAATQGEIGYILQYAMWQILQRERMHIPVVTLITQVIVDSRDPAFQNPTKPVGPYYSKDVADRYDRYFGWTLVQDTAQGYRRVVPSPAPKQLVELEAIRACVERGLVVIAAGGGGVPVFNDHDITKGVEAVVDKDLTSALLASELKADTFLIATGEPLVYLDYGKPTRRPVAHLSDEDCRQYMSEGQFPEGSMLPKINAALTFLERGGEEVIITDIPHLQQAIQGRAGTHIQVSHDTVDWP